MVSLVSVIIPVYNRKELLTAAVESVLGQTYQNFELIIVDDFSSDGTAQLVHKLAAEHTNIISVLLPNHLGMAGAVRNRGVEAASGNYVAFLDSDDFWLPEKLELQMPLLLSGGYRIVHTREKWLRRGKEISQSSQTHRKCGDIFQDALHKCIIGPSTVILDKKLYQECGGFDEKLEIAEDYEFWLRITALEKVGYLDRVLTVKQAGNWEQLSEKYGQIEIFRIHALDKLLAGKFFDREKFLLAAESFAEKCRIYAAGCSKRGKNKEAEIYEKLAEKYL